jgi:hypothetical protein
MATEASKKNQLISVAIAERDLNNDVLLAWYERMVQIILSLFFMIMLDLCKSKSHFPFLIVQGVILPQPKHLIEPSSNAPILRTPNAQTNRFFGQGRTIRGCGCSHAP